MWSSVSDVVVSLACCHSHYVTRELQDCVEPLEEISELVSSSWANWLATMAQPLPPALVWHLGVGTGGPQTQGRCSPPFPPSPTLRGFPAPLPLSGGHSGDVILTGDILLHTCPLTFSGGSWFPIALLPPLQGLSAPNPCPAKVLRGLLCVLPADCPLICPPSMALGPIPLVGMARQPWPARTRPGRSCSWPKRQQQAQASFLGLYNTSTRAVSGCTGRRCLS